ncbi:hypothetical protein RHS04_02050 [Rhizoctonia solani]|uniref:Uncharacterized protein n=1 Tax=Rhizoctonia solani TaxID=456999 RepID=A0A8H7HFX6_9AGAM|nr:hypothetical protein RHS04_02050 [Rhizoctonia solani]
MGTHAAWNKLILAPGTNAHSADSLRALGGWIPSTHGIMLSLGFWGDTPVDCTPPQTHPNRTQRNLFGAERGCAHSLLATRARIYTHELDFKKYIYTLGPRNVYPVPAAWRLGISRYSYRDAWDGIVIAQSGHKVLFNPVQLIPKSEPNTGAATEVEAETPSGSHDLDTPSGGSAPRPTGRGRGRGRARGSRARGKKRVQE